MTKVNFLGEECSVRTERYANGRPRISLICEDGSPMAIATVNIPEVEIPESTAFIKDYSENEGMVQALQEAGVIGIKLTEVSIGYVNIGLYTLNIS